MLPVLLNYLFLKLSHVTKLVENTKQLFRKNREKDEEKGKNAVKEETIGLGGELEEYDSYNERWA